MEDGIRSPILLALSSIVVANAGSFCHSQGTCQYGSECRFEHPVRNPAPPPPAHPAPLGESKFSFSSMLQDPFSHILCKVCDITFLTVLSSVEASEVFCKP